MHTSLSKAHAVPKWKTCLAKSPIAALSILLLTSCSQPAPTPPIQGSWKLISGTTISGKDTSITDYTKDQSMIKIINKDHFAFLHHDLHPPKDSSNHFDAGGGAYTLSGNQYTEHLDYYNDRNWEGKIFTFTISIANDTLIQQGLEKVEGAGIDRIIIEKYIRIP